MSARAHNRLSKINKLKEVIFHHQTPPNDFLESIFHHLVSSFSCALGDDGKIIFNGVDATRKMFHCPLDDLTQPNLSRLCESVSSALPQQAGHVPVINLTTRCFSSEDSRRKYSR